MSNNPYSGKVQFKDIFLATTFAVAYIGTILAIDNYQSRAEQETTRKNIEQKFEFPKDFKTLEQKN